MLASLGASEEGEQEMRTQEQSGSKRQRGRDRSAGRMLKTAMCVGTKGFQDLKGNREGEDCCVEREDAEEESKEAMPCEKQG